MKVAIYHNAYPTGAKRTVYELAREFKAHGSQVDIYTTPLSDESYLPSSEVSDHLFNYPLTFHPPLSQKLRLPFLRKYVALGIDLSNLAKLDAVESKIADDIAAGGYDLALIHSTRLVKAPFVLRYLKPRGAPSVYFCQEPPRELYEASVLRSYSAMVGRVDRIQGTWYRPTDWYWMRRIKLDDQRNLKSAGCVLANSFFSAENIFRVYGIYPKVTYLGVNTGQFSPCQIPKENFVISAGAVAPLKGYDFIIRALALLDPNIRPRFVIAATTFSPAETTYLEELAEKSCVKLEFVRNPAQTHLVELYNQAVACVYAPHLEPLGLVPLEAMACGTPVVAVREGGVRESVRDGETGLLVPRDECAFAESLTAVLGDARLAQRLGENGRAEVLRFWTWEHAYERLMANLNELSESSVKPSPKSSV